MCTCIYNIHTNCYMWVCIHTRIVTCDVYTQSVPGCEMSCVNISHSGSQPWNKCRCATCPNLNRKREIKAPQVREKDSVCWKLFPILLTHSSVYLFSQLHLMGLSNHLRFHQTRKQRCSRHPGNRRGLYWGGNTNTQLYKNAWAVFTSPACCCCSPISTSPPRHLSLLELAVHSVRTTTSLYMIN